MYQDINNDDDVKNFLMHVQHEQDKRQGSVVYMTSMEKERAQQRKRSIAKLRNSIRSEQGDSPKKNRSFRSTIQGSPYSSPTQGVRKTMAGLGGTGTPAKNKSGGAVGSVKKGDEIRRATRAL